MNLQKCQNVKIEKNNLYLSLDGFDTDLKFHFNKRSI
jgi:hypothetical protein